MNLKWEELLSTALADTGFQMAYSDDKGNEILFVQRHDADLFERIRVGFGTQVGVGNLVYAGVECSIVPGQTGLKGMTEFACLLECATDKTSGWAVLRTEIDKAHWIEALARIAPSKASELSRVVGPDLLAYTTEARRAANVYFAECKKLGSVEEAVGKLKSIASESQLEESLRILSYPVVVIPNGALVYELATLAIVMLFERVEGNRDWLKQKDVGSTDDRGLMIRLQILASKLAGEPGW